MAKTWFLISIDSSDFDEDNILHALQDTIGGKGAMEISVQRQIRPTPYAPDRLWRGWARRISKFFMQYGYKFYRKFGGR